MPHHFKGERTRMRIYIGESDKTRSGTHAGRPLHKALLQLLRERGFAGATVIRGISGFGASAVVHTQKILRLSMDLPLIVEVIETDDRIRALLPDLDALIGGGLITLEPTRVIMYRPADIAEEDRQRHAIDESAGDGYGH